MVQIFKNTNILLISLCFLFFTGDLLSDIIHLKSGGQIEGHVVSAVDEFVIIQTSTGKRNILANNIERVEVGYSGISACYTKGKGGKKICKGVVHKLAPEKVSFGTGSGNIANKNMRSNEVAMLEFKKQGYQKIVPVLQKGVKLKLKLRSGSVEGKVSEKNNDNIKMTLNDGSSRIIKENEILGGVFFKPGCVRIQFTLSFSWLSPIKERIVFQWHINTCWTNSNGSRWSR